jgi:hypothetical protein
MIHRTSGSSRVDGRRSNWVCWWDSWVSAWPGEVPDDRKPASATWQRARLAPIAARGGVHRGLGMARYAMTVPH